MGLARAADDFRDDGLSLRFARCCAKIPRMAKRRHRRRYTGPSLTDHLNTGGLCLCTNFREVRARSELSCPLRLNAMVQRESAQGGDSCEKP